jgi:DNA primase
MKGKMSLAELREMEELNEQAKRGLREPLNLPEDFTTDISLQGRLWLYKAGLSPSDWAKHGFGYSPSTRRVVLPVFNQAGELVWQQHRAVITGQTPKYLQPARDKGDILYVVKPDTGHTKRVIVVEDILSATRVGRYQTAISILGTKLSAGQAKRLAEFSEVTTWLDGDRAGLTGSKAIRKSMSLVTTVSNIQTELDPKEYSDHEIRRILCLKDINDGQ